MKRILAVVFGLVLVLVLLLAVAPFFFRGAVERQVDAALERRVDARVEHGPVGLSLLRHFPNLAIGIDDLTVTGVDSFEGDTLAHTDRFELTVDLGSVIRMFRSQEPLVVRQVQVDRPYIHARVLEDGRVSWDIMKAVEEVTAGPEGGERSVQVDLRRLEVEDGRVVFEDLGTGLEVRITGLGHTLSGDFSADRFDLDTRTAADAVTVRRGGMVFLDSAEVYLDADLAADMTARRFTFRENRLTVNALGVSFEGMVEAPDEGLDLDLTFVADGAGLRDILSLAPTLFNTDFDNLTAEGVVDVQGFVRGRLQTERVPSFGLTAQVDGGRFQYADLPSGFRDVNLDLAIAQPAQNLDSTVVELRRLAFVLGDDSVEASFAMATPVSDPEVRASVMGSLDLAAAGRVLKLEGIDELTGRAVADASVHTRRSWLETEAYDRIESQGRLTARGVTVAGPAVPQPLAIDDLRLELSPRSANLSVLQARYGSSDVRASGRLDHLLGFLLHGQTLEGQAGLESRFVALDELRRKDAQLDIIPVPGNVDLVLDVTVDSVRLGRLSMYDVRGRTHVQDRRATLDGLALRSLGGDMVVTGWYETPVEDPPAFQLDLAIVDVRIPAAFQSLDMVQALAPVAGYATGAFSADLSLAAPLATGLRPVLGALTGGGGIRTHDLGLQSMPVLERMAQSLRMEALRNPTISDIAASIRIDDGRLHVRPFNVQLGPAAVVVSGANGIDGRLDYNLELKVPRSFLGIDSNPLVTALRDRAQRAGLELSDIQDVGLSAAIGGTFTDPSVSVELAEAVTRAGTELTDQARTRIQEEVTRQADEARERVEEVRSEAEAKALARADSMVAAAERQAQRIRNGADSTAAAIRDEADRRADQLVSEATNPVARRAAEAAGNQLRREADRRATQLEDEADRRAQALVDEARQRARDVLERAGVEPAPDSAASASGGSAVPADSTAGAPPDTTGGG